MDKPTEMRVISFATIILIIAFLVAHPTERSTAEQFRLQQSAVVDLQLKQTSEKTELFLNVKCESLLRPMSKITGAFFNVDLCKE
ncbi:MAG: hypothetical protein AABW64_01180 [Nanoarchaeota archaeon]